MGKKDVWQAAPVHTPGMVVVKGQAVKRAGSMAGYHVAIGNTAGVPPPPPGQSDDNYHWVDV